MVLESLINPLKAEREPIDMFFLGSLYSSIAVLLSLWVFKEHSSLVMVFLTVMATVPLMVATLKMEEKKDLVYTGEMTILREHAKALKFFMYLFIGFILSYTFWYIILPSDIVSTLFKTQTETINGINMGNVIGFNTQSFGVFSKIFLNNVRVLIFCILFSFLYGAGAIFILAWNASVISAAIGNFIRTSLDAALIKFGALWPHHYVSIISIGLLKYSLHGIPEILAYFVGALAGGIISVAAINHDFGSKTFEKIVFDSVELVILSVVLLLIAAFLEVYATPLFF